MLVLVRAAGQAKRRATSFRRDIAARIPIATGTRDLAVETGQI
jgi:hypothetical protein